MAYKIKQRVSSCRAPPGGALRFILENLYCIGKMAVFPAQSSFLKGKHDCPAIGEQGRARQITSALTATIQLWLHRGIIHFFKEAAIWQEKKAPLGAKCVSGSIPTAPTKATRPGVITSAPVKNLIHGADRLVLATGQCGMTAVGRWSSGGMFCWNLIHPAPSIHMWQGCAVVWASA